MAISFPANPNENDSFTSNGKTWVWSGGRWKIVGASNRGLSLEISDAAPSNPVQGDMWYESDSGRTYTYYDNVWIELGNTSAVYSFIADDDTDTLIQVEESADEDVIRFDVGGVEKAVLDSSGLSITGDIEVSGSYVGLSSDSVRDADNDTKVEVEATADSDAIRFTTASTPRFEVTSAGHIVPSEDVTYDLGSSSYRFRDLYLSGNTIDLGGATISYDGTHLHMGPMRVDANGTGGTILPSGTTAERPVSPTAGMMRFNETTGEPEWYSSDKGRWFFFRQSPSVEITGADSYNLVTINGVTYTVLSFNSTATFSVVSGGLIDVMVVGGGGGGGATMGGGGGAGGLVYKASILTSGGTSGNITVGAGGLGGKGYNQTDQNGTSGGNSVFSYGALTLTANGGGGGAGWAGYPSLSGGSGGGGATTAGTNSTTTVASSATQPGTNPSADIDAGYAGGNGYGYSSSTRTGGGGGGAGGVGETKTSGGTNVAGVGGAGLDMSNYFTNIFGDGGYFAGGGGGGGDSGGNAGGAGGLGGGGEGGDTADGSYTIVAARNGTANTGGGGGGLHYKGSSTSDGIRYGGYGGSGIVLVRYQT